jgi:hypothetical protein
MSTLPPRQSIVGRSGHAGLRATNENVQPKGQERR